MVNKKAASYYLIIAIVILAFLLFLFFFINNYGSMEGTRIGLVTSIEHQGNIFFPADIVQFNSGNTEKFCVNDWDLMKSLDAASKNEYVVKISYYRPTITWVWKCNGGSAIIRDIDYVRG